MKEEDMCFAERRTVACRCRCWAALSSNGRQQDKAQNPHQTHKKIYPHHLHNLPNKTLFSSFLSPPLCDCDFLCLWLSFFLSLLCVINGKERERERRKKRSFGQWGNLKYLENCQTDWLTTVTQNL